MFNFPVNYKINTINMYIFGIFYNVMCNSRCTVIVSSSIVLTCIALASIKDTRMNFAFDQAEINNAVVQMQI